MEPQAYVDALERESRALAEAADGHLEARVPSCPEWSVADLVWHTQEVHSFWEQVVGQQLQDPRTAVVGPRPPVDLLVTAFRRGADRLARLLAEADPKATVWTWAPQRNVAFVQRRMAHESAVHRWDAQAATAPPEPVEPALAIDGIDEFLDFFVDDVKDGVGETDSYSVHLHATDSRGEWVARVRGRTTEVARAHAKGDVAVRGGASDLLLLLWRRLDPRHVEVLGDAAVLDRFLARPSLE